MEADKCQKCDTVFDTEDLLLTPLELPCEHDVCVKCYLADIGHSEEETKTINCLVCNEQFKLRRGNLSLLNHARKKQNEDDILMCERHPQQPVVYICQSNQKLLCWHCILEPYYHERMKDLIIYRKSDV